MAVGAGVGEVIGRVTSKRNGGKITAKGVDTSFVVGTVFSEVGSVASEKILKCQWECGDLMRKY